MKVTEFFDSSGRPTEEYRNALRRQNGKKSIARRAAAMKGQTSKRKRRLAARNSAPH